MGSLSGTTIPIYPLSSSTSQHRKLIYLYATYVALIFNLSKQISGVVIIKYLVHW